MNNYFSFILKSCRILKKPNTLVLYSSCVNNSLYWSTRRVVFRNMSQKSIMSFFKATPKKSPDSKEHVDKPAKRSRSICEEDVSPEKQTSRSPSPVTSGKKNKVKRQRIESSDSESETITPVSAEQDDVQVKEEVENKVIKTYSSPKTKNVRIKAEKSPLVEKNEASKKRPSKSPSASKEKINIKKEKSPKTVKSPVLKVVNGVKKEKDDDSKSGPVPETEYNPAKSNYNPVNDACWSEGQEVPYLALAKTFEAIEPISARLKIIEILSNYFRSVIALTPDDLLPSVYMCLNQLAPAYHSLELGIAETYLMKAIGQCTGRTLAQVKAAAHKSGDLGQVAESARATQRMMFAPPPLSARKVFAALKEIANFTGQASVNKKIQRIQSLYVACRHSEARYLIRSLEGKLRIGLAEQSVLQALAVAATATPPPCGGDLVLDASKGLSPEQFKSKVDETSLIIKTTYCECPNYDMIIPVLLEEGVQALPLKCKLTPGIPLKPMLAHPTKGVHEVFNRFENTLFTCEWKYDGERAQIHVPGTSAPDLDRAAIYSRNQENNTSKYPDILRRLPALLKDTVTSCVLDCEAVAYDTEKKQILPFQILSTRKRKDANEADIKVKVCVFVFDLLYLNGRPLVTAPLAERRKLMMEHLNTVEGEWQFATSRDCNTMEEVQQFLEESVKGSCEGLMVKTLEGPSAKYDIARRSHNWLKLKKDYLEGVGDTVDAVVIGGYLGKGKRTGVYGGFLLACYDPDTEEYQSLCKIGTGFSEEDLQTLSKDLADHVIEAPRNYYRFDSGLCPDAWFAPTRVWEVRCADLSLSPVHCAARGRLNAARGLSLRFPRFIRVRDDKTPEQATSAQQIVELYLSQDQVKNSASEKTNFDDFY